MVVVTLQQVTKGICPYLTLCGHPQTCNKESSFNNNVVTALTKNCRKEKDMELLNIAFDGVSCNADFVCYELFKFMEGKSIHLGITDTNHNFNNFRYQIIGGYGCAIIGKCIIDPELLCLADVNKDLWRINDYASDFLVLKLASYDTLSNICGAMGNEDASSVG